MCFFTQYGRRASFLYYIDSREKLLEIRYMIVKNGRGVHVGFAGFTDSLVCKLISQKVSTTMPFSLEDILYPQSWILRWVNKFSDFHYLTTHQRVLQHAARERGGTHSQLIENPTNS